MKTTVPCPASHSSEPTPFCVDRLRAGDHAAGNLLEQEYRTPLLRFCSNYLDTREDIEDAVQEVFCRAMANTRTPDNFRAWLYRIARNYCLNHLRAQARRRDSAPLPDGSIPGVPRSSVGTHVARKELLSRVGELVDALPCRLREPLRLRYVEGLQFAEVALVLDISESLAKARVYQAMRSLTEQLARLEVGEPTTPHPALQKVRR